MIDGNDIIKPPQAADGVKNGLKSTVGGLGILLQNDFSIDTTKEPSTARDKVKDVFNRLYDILSGNPKLQAALKGKSISQRELVARLADLGIPIKNLTDGEIVKAVLQAAGFSAAEIAKLTHPVLDPYPTDEPAKEAKPKTPKQPATENKPVAESKPAAASKPATPPVRPEGLDENGYQAWLAITQISGRSDSKQLAVFRKAWVDGKISLDEARELGIAGKDDQLFMAADNKMRVTSTGYNGIGENDHYLSLAELKEVVKVALDYAKMAGQVDPSTTFDMYRTMYLMDVDFDGIRNKLDAFCAAGGAGLHNLDLTKLADKTYIATQFSTLKSLLSNELFDLLTARLEKKEFLKPGEIGIYIFRCAMASMTANYNGFGVPELKDAKIAQFKPRRPETSAEDFAYWVKEGKVKEEEVASGKSSDAEAAQKAEIARREISSAKNAEEAVKKYEEAIRDGKLPKDDKEALDAIANKYLRGKEYAKLVDFAKKLDAGIKDQFYAQVFENIQKEIVATMGNTNKLDEAVKSLEEIDSLVKGMAEAGNKFKGEVAKMQLQVALRFAEATPPNKEKAYALIDKMPSDVEIAWKAGEETKSLNKHEVCFMVAEKFKDAKPMNDLLKDEKSTATDRTLAHTYLAKIKGNPSDKGGLENILKEYEAAAKEIKKEEAPKARALRERIRGEMEEAITKYHRSHQTNAVASTMQKLRDKYINKMPDPDASAATAKKSGKGKDAKKGDKIAKNKANYKDL